MKKCNFTGLPWSEEETDLLQELCGAVPPELLIDTFNDRAAQMNFPRRTYQAIRAKASSKGFMITPAYSCHDRFTLTDIARHLGYHQTTVQKWKNRGLFDVVHVGTYFYVTCQEMIRFAESHPRLFAGRSYDGLCTLLGDRSLAHVYHRLKRPSQRGRAIKHIETGTVYESAAEASRRLHIDQSAICCNLRGKSKRTIVGRFEYADAPKINPVFRAGLASPTRQQVNHEGASD